MGVKVILLVIFFAVMAVVGNYSRRHTKSVDGLCWVDGSVGPGSRHLRMGRLIFRRSYLSDMRDSLDGNTELQAPGLESEMQ